MPENEIMEENNITKKRKNKNSERDYFTHIIAVQFIVVALLLGGVFAVKKLSPDNFELIRQSYINLMQKDTTVSEAFTNIRNSLSPPVGGDDISVFSPQIGTSFSPYYISSEICVPVSGSISSPFGYRVNPVTKTFSFHSGVDIAAESGEKIKAAYYGTVSKVAYDDVSGNYIELTHDDGLITRYLHCSEIIAEEGTVVRSGETIALVGSTGRSTGPHLHFVIEIDGKKVDPLYVMEVNDNKV